MDFLNRKVSFCDPASLCLLWRHCCLAAHVDTPTLSHTHCPFCSMTRLPEVLWGRWWIFSRMLFEGDTALLLNHLAAVQWCLFWFNICKTPSAKAPMGVLFSCGAEWVSPLESRLPLHLTVTSPVWTQGVGVFEHYLNCEEGRSIEAEVATRAGPEGPEKMTFLTLHRWMMMRLTANEVCWSSLVSDFSQVSW